MKNIVFIVLAIAFIAGPTAATAQPVAPAATAAEKKQMTYDDAYRNRIKRINDRIRRKQIEADCKAEAKTTYRAIHFQKRRAFVKACIARNSA